MDHRRHVQQEELITEQKPLEKRKLLEIWSSNDSRVGNFCCGECIVKEKRGVKLRPAGTG